MLQSTNAHKIFFAISIGVQPCMLQDFCLFIMNSEQGYYQQFSYYQ